MREFGDCLIMLAEEAVLGSDIDAFDGIVGIEADIELGVESGEFGFGFVGVRRSGPRVWVAFLGFPILGATEWIQQLIGFPPAIFKFLGRPERRGATIFFLNGNEPNLKEYSENVVDLI